MCNEVRRSNRDSAIQWERVGKYQPYPVRPFESWIQACFKFESWILSIFGVNPESLESSPVQFKIWIWIPAPNKPLNIESLTPSSRALLMVAPLGRLQNVQWNWQMKYIPPCNSSALNWTLIYLSGKMHRTLPPLSAANMMKSQWGSETKSHLTKH